MKVEQISIFIEHKSGRLAEITRILGEAGINIRALSLADTSDFGILRLIVNEVEKAKAVLKEKGFTVSKTEVVAVEVPDQPGGLSTILQALSVWISSADSALGRRIKSGLPGRTVSRSLNP